MDNSCADCGRKWIDLNCDNDLCSDCEQAIADQLRADRPPTWLDSLRALLGKEPTP